MIDQCFAGLPRPWTDSTAAAVCRGIHVHQFARMPLHIIQCLPASTSALQTRLGREPVAQPPLCQRSPQLCHKLGLDAAHERGAAGLRKGLN